MYSSELLIRGRLPPIQDEALLQFATESSHGKIWRGQQVQDAFISQAGEYLAASQWIKVLGLEHFRHTHAIMGCNHFIDNLVMQHGIKNLQIFEHDYGYYRRLCPDLEFAQPGNLVPRRPVLIAAPFPGALDLHWRWHDIIDECERKGIAVHIDAAWLGAARDITLDVSAECIKSIAMSFSKSHAMNWNRVGIRWSRDAVQDSITMMNQANMIPEITMRVAMRCMQRFSRDYLWDHYHDRYQDICRQLRLRPGCIIHAVHSLDRRQLLGLAGFFAPKS